MKKVFTVFSVFAFLLSLNIAAEDQAQTAQPSGDLSVSATETPAPQPVETKEPEKKDKKWYEKFDLKGDFRYRYELIDKSTAGSRHYQRNRIRARLGIKAPVYDQMDAMLQIATSYDDPVSTNQTLSTGFSGKPIRLDLAYFDWHPNFFKGMHLYGGKMKNVFYAPGASELLWDHDLNPEGLALTHKHTFKYIELFGAASGFWAQERSTARDTWLLGFQGTGKYSFSESGIYLLTGVGFFNYTSIKGKPTLYDATDSFGNTIDAATNYAFDYNELEVMGEMGGKIKDIPVAVFVDFVINTASKPEPADDKGYLFGLTVGKCKDPWTWAMRYNYRKIEKDAVVAVFTDSDFIGGGTDGRGHEFGADLAVAKNTKIGASYFFNELKATGGDNYHRLQLDLQLNF